MTLLEQLERAGVSLSQDVGFIIDTRDNTNTWRNQRTTIARVCVEIPDGTEHDNQVKDFNPEYNLMLKWEENEIPYASIISVTDDADLYEIADGGLIIDSPDIRIIIGQSSKFMKNVRNICRALENRKNTKH